MLFAFLAKKVGGPKVEGKQLVTTLLSGILASPPFSDVSSNSLQPCSHEEADTRLFLHVQDCSRSGSRVMIRSTDTDVIVLAVANFRRLPVQEIWIAFGVGKHFRYLPAHEIALQLGPQSSEALPMFHVFSGCDTVSFFAGKGKNKCWETWKSFPEATATFLLLAKGPERSEPSCFSILELFVVLMYSKSSQATKVNEVRQSLFSRQFRSLENIPPTQAALHQHILRSVYQGGHIWGHCLEKEPKGKDPAGWGWQQGRGNKSSATGTQVSSFKVPWVPVWTTLEQAAKSCHELIHCSCKKGCRGWCKCKKNNLKCTSLCACGGDC